ncbi:MAG: hypothetical protein KJZ54_05335 [Phycisphaerales bacterium]|nr:hypothetical protein [Phycisphaerales bacterium]
MQRSVRIPTASQALLREVLGLRAPHLLALLPTRYEFSLDVKILDEIRSVLGDEMCTSGLDSNDEPNDRGLAIEDLIDLLGP